MQRKVGDSSRGFEQCDVGSEAVSLESRLGFQGFFARSEFSDPHPVILIAAGRLQCGRVSLGFEPDQKLSGFFSYLHGADLDGVANLDRIFGLRGLTADRWPLTADRWPLNRLTIFEPVSGQLVVRAKPTAHITTVTDGGFPRVTK